MSHHGGAHEPRRGRSYTRNRDGVCRRRRAKVCLLSLSRLGMRAPQNNDDRLTMPSYSSSSSYLHSARSANTSGRPSPKLSPLPPHPSLLHLPTLSSTRSLTNPGSLGPLPALRHAHPPPLSSDLVPLSRRNRPDTSVAGSSGSPLSYPVDRDGRLAEASLPELARHSGAGLGGYRRVESLTICMVLIALRYARACPPALRLYRDGVWPEHLISGRHSSVPRC